MKYKEIEGDLIKLALKGNFDVIAHGCNCQCTMGAGIALQMAKAFGANNYLLEGKEYKGDVNKLSQIDFGTFYTKEGEKVIAYLINKNNNRLINEGWKKSYAVNCYTQFMYGTNHEDGVSKPLDYEALTLCMKKINHIFKGKHIGLPYVIGCGLAGGDIRTVIDIIKKELFNMDVTMVKFNK